MRLCRTTLLTLALSLIGNAVFAYTIYLKDGSQLISKEKYTVEDGRAVIILSTGTQTSIAMEEIDVERTEAANDVDYGGVVVLDDASVKTIPSQTRTEERPTLAQMIQPSGRNQLERSTDREPSEAVDPLAASQDLSRTRRTPYRQLDVGNQIEQLLRSRGVDQVSLYQGTRPRRVLVDITTNNEAAVFRALEATAKAVTTLANQRPDEVEAFEVYMQTDRRVRAGQFLMTPDKASELISGTIEAGEFFLRHVQF